jgi:hypothetical protein
MIGCRARRPEVSHFGALCLLYNVHSYAFGASCYVTYHYTRTCVGACPDPRRGPNRGLRSGITVGEPTGLTSKLWVSEHTAFAGAIAWSFRNCGSLQIQGYYLIHLELTGEIKRDMKGRFYFHYGIGDGSAMIRRTTGCRFAYPWELRMLSQSHLWISSLKLFQCSSLPSKPVLTWVGNRRQVLFRKHVSDFQRFPYSMTRVVPFLAHKARNEMFCLANVL